VSTLSEAVAVALMPDRVETLMGGQARATGCVHLNAVGHCEGSTAVPDERGSAPDDGVLPNKTFAKAAASRDRTCELKIRDLA